MTHQTWRLVREGKKEWEFLQVLPGPHPHRWGHTGFSFHASPSGDHRIHVPIPSWGGTFRAESKLMAVGMEGLWPKPPPGDPSAPWFRALVGFSLTVRLA